METTIAEIFSKIKAIVKGPQGELFTKIVDSFYEQVGDEYFSPEDLDEIQSGLDEIKRGEHLAWEDCKSKHGL
ncbi:MAG: hypothetical protein ACLP2P_10290 [Desulfobaccales bacterium]|jgi:hypothetical protein